ncbi:class A beta-lactamase-related serine hydrolase [Actinomadura sp. KC06]|uniref:serine hydrolase domain-containing protein n=1 Tax=Actinomadura sp. KC06 TaxID=2530369 RepID=UPI00104504C5|nr:serine hydrolase domain-containing protein [Actinomadura sp. KC06]TDD32258.1 class A beta-lactamase-related serine hydrolase [Actinomadura sp. KC06]
MLRKVIAAAGIVGLAAAGTVTMPGASASADDDHRRLRLLIQRIATQDGAPGAMARVEERDGRKTVIRSGVGDLGTGAPIPEDGHWRIGSMTKPFVATVVLQLVGEDEVELDAPVDRYLPGLVDRRITVRHILQHTSGLPDYLKHLSMPDIIANPLTGHDRRDLLATALKHPPLFKPGKGWSYGNTGYLLAGMLIEKVTGRPYGEEIKRRILEPLELRHTYVPVEESFLPRPHPRGYVRTAPDAAPLDRTRLNPSVAPSSGNMVSTASDVNRFFGALLGGRLLDRPELREMMTTRRTGRESGSRYGLGLERVRLPCGGHLWGHAGDFIGFSTRSGVNADGRTVTIMANLKPGNTDAQDDDLAAALTTALCD